MDRSATATSPPAATGEFEAEWWVVGVCVAALMCSAVTSARLLHHGTSLTRRASFPTSASRVLLCSQAAAGLLQVTVSSPVLLLALTDCYRSEESPWACNIGWVAWGWAWGVQVLGVLAISYERVRFMSRPLQGPLPVNTAILLAGAAWVCGGIVGVSMGKGLHCSLITRGHPGLAIGVLGVAVLPVLLLGGLWAHGIRRLRRSATSLQAGNGSSSYLTNDNDASRWHLPTPQPADTLEAIMFTVSQWASPLFAGPASPPPTTCTAAPSPTLHADTLLEGSRSPSLVYSRRSSLLEEDTFTVGGVYIGSLQSHIRAHSGFCTDQNVRSQGCQTGEEESSPPVVEWRVLPPTPTLQETPPLPAAPEVADIGVQCCGGVEAASSHPRGNRVTGELDRLLVHENSCRVEAVNATPAFVLSVVQALMGIPLPLIALALQLMDPGPVWAWRVTLTALAFTSPAPALAQGAYLFAVASITSMPSDM